MKQTIAQERRNAEEAISKEIQKLRESRMRDLDNQMASREAALRTELSSTRPSAAVPTAAAEAAPPASYHGKALYDPEEAVGMTPTDAAVVHGLNPKYIGALNDSVEEQLTELQEHLVHEGADERNVHQYTKAIEELVEEL